MTESTETYPIVRRLVVIGLGLIGGSLAIAARRRGVCEEVWGVAPWDHIREKALELGIVERAFSNIADIASELGEGDVIFVAVPTLSVASVLAQIRPCVSPEVTISDGASVKGSVLEDVRQVYGYIPKQVVLGHPIAGSEKSGIEAANPDLYENHRVILTPLPETGPLHLARVQSLWRAVGAEVLHLDVQQHDEILAATSHLPHAIAFSLVDTLAHDSQNQDIFRYAAGGFRDFTRIASSDATMWRDIMLANKDSVVKAIDLFAANLDRLRQAVVQQKEQELLGVFTRAKAARDHFTRMLQHRPLVEVGALSKVSHFRVSPKGRVCGNLRVPGDKAISHRAVMLGALAEGITEIHGFLESEDALATLQAFRDMGVVISGPSDGKVVIHGVGLHGLQPPVGALYLGNSGTSMRLLAGILAGQPFDTVLDGADGLSRKSMARVIEALTKMGAVITSAKGCTAPLQIKGGRTLSGIRYAMPVAGAQVKSSLLLAGLYAKGATRVVEPVATRDHTERMLQGFGCPISREDRSVELAPGCTLKGCRIDVPADLSSAIFFIVAASVVEGSDLRLPKVGINPTRLAAVNILQQMGADIAFSNVHKVGGEPVADIQVRHAPLKGVAIQHDQAVLEFEDIPAIMVAAACAEGTTFLAGIKDSRLNDHPRISAMVDGLQRLGIDCRINGDGLQIIGGAIGGGEVESGGDYRVAIAFTIAALRATDAILVRDCTGVAASFPDFTGLARQAGISLEAVIR